MKMGVGCVIVNYNTPEIISKAVHSVIDQVDKLVIVDGSDTGNPAYKECDSLISNKVSVIHTHRNTGHGPGLHLGIVSLDVEFIICMDSDAVLIDKTLIPEMRKALSAKEVYGVGHVARVNRIGENIKTEKNYIGYLHPYFCMFRNAVYFKYHAFINHGAPFILTMRQIQGKMKLVYIKDMRKRCLHEGKVTRGMIGERKWGKNWVKI